MTEVIEEYHFIELSPPQTNWEVGSVIEVDPAEPSAPTLRARPSDAGAPVVKMASEAPKVSRSHDEKFDLSLGLTLPKGIGIEAKLKGATQYSVVADGNVIQRIPLDPYAEAFKVIRNKFGANWTRALQDRRLFYIYELWFAQTLEYKFYDEKGASLKLTVPIKIPVNFQSEWSSTDQGSVVYSGQNPICLGYKKRAVNVRSPSGEIVPEATGEITVEPMEARIKLDKPR